MAKCDKCEAPLVWAVTEGGAWMALDELPPMILGHRAPPRPGAPLYAVTRGSCRPMSDEDRRLKRDAYTAHRCGR